MADPKFVRIPVFLLRLIPIPGELVPLHIFEPRYRQLLEDAENDDVRFGIYCQRDINQQGIGSLMRLESVIKRYPDGTSDIVVKCLDLFHVQRLDLNFPGKLYPGGDVIMVNVEDQQHIPDEGLVNLFNEYMTLRNINRSSSSVDIFSIANELNLELVDKYQFLVASDDRKHQILTNRLKLAMYILDQEVKSRDVYYLN